MDTSPVVSSASELIAERRSRVESLNSKVKSYYEATDTETILTEFNGDGEIVRFLLDFFRPTEENPQLRKDGRTYVVNHSLELYLKARSFGIGDPRVLHLCLLHDVIEDTHGTLQDVIDLERSQGIEIAKFVRILTEDKSGKRSQVAFVDQIVASEGLDAEERNVVIIVELLDRMDDLSDAAYLTEILDSTKSSPEKKNKTRQKLIRKLAKCEYTIIRCISGCREEKVEELVNCFQMLANDLYDRYQISASELMIAMKDLE